MPKATTSTSQIPAAQAPLAAAPQDVIDMLNRLIDTCADGAYGFASCADYSNISRHRTLFRQRAQDCDEASSGRPTTITNSRTNDGYSADGGSGLFSAAPLMKMTSGSCDTSTEMPRSKALVGL